MQSSATNWLSHADLGGAMAARASKLVDPLQIRISGVHSRPGNAARGPTSRRPRLIALHTQCGARPDQERLQAATMDEAYGLLAQRALAGASRVPPGTARYVIGVAGVPGGGKSTLAREVTARINAAAGADVAVNVPMDGFHLFRRELDAMADPAAAAARRGAHWTFDAAAYVACLRALKTQPGAALAAPSFDHGVGDPAPGAISVAPHHAIVISEGNYLLLEEAPWGELVEGGVLDEAWYVECDLETAMARVFERQTGHGVAPEVSRGRIAGNDRPNGELIEGTKGRAGLMVSGTLPLRAG